MDPTRSYCLLTRIRTSSRLAVLVLLVFALKLGSAAACAQHDFADLGLGQGGETSPTAVLDIVDTDPGDPSGTNTLSHLGACSHCGSHHASAVTGDGLTTAVQGSTLVADCYSPPAFTLAANPELRPPIA